MSGITIPTLDEITGHTVMAKMRSLCKRFIGLAEEVDDKIDAPLAEAHLAVETANATLATAQESLDDAQDAVTTANSASETANSASETANLASESAQESAETVAGYNTRLTMAEGKISDLETADANNVKITGTHKIGDYALLLTGNQDYGGTKRAINTIVKRANIEGSTLPNNYWIDNHLIDVRGITDDVPIISIGSERGNTGWSTRINLNLYGSIDETSQRQNSARIIYIFDEINKQIRMQVGHYDAVTNITTYSTAQTLMSW